MILNSGIPTIRVAKKKCKPRHGRDKTYDCFLYSFKSVRCTKAELEEEQGFKFEFSPMLTVDDINQARALWAHKLQN